MWDARGVPAGGKDVPAVEWVPPDLVTIFVTPNGPYAPCFLYRLAEELYGS